MIRPFAQALGLGLALTLPTPNAPISQSAARLAATLSQTERSLANAIDRWDKTSPPPRDVTLLALYEQRMIRLLGERPVLKLFVGGLTTPEVLLEHVAQFQADTEERLAGLREIEPTNSNRGHDWFHRHLLRYGIECAEHELLWADGVERALRRGPR